MNGVHEINPNQTNWSKLNTCGLVKRLIYVRVGLAVISHDKLESQIDKLEKRGREATKNRIIFSGDGIRGLKHYYLKENIKIKHIIDEYLSNFIIPISRDFTNLIMKITDLETEIDQIVKKKVNG